jgi:SAM-dependent methyltransferase
MYENRILLAPVHLDVKDAVLEIGTGPGELLSHTKGDNAHRPTFLQGLWIMDLAKSVNTSIPMFAIDIESRNFPVSPPKQIEFRVESATRLPAEWTNTFSLVHQRLLMAGLQRSEWPIVLGEIHRVLRPGGWVQLGESSTWGGEHPGKPCLEKLTAMVRSIASSRNLNLDCAKDMPKMLADAGFVEVQSESRMQRVGKWNGESGVANRINQVALFKSYKTPVLKAGGIGYVSSEEESDLRLEGVEREWDEIPGTEKEFFIFLAKKPLVQLH